MKRFYIGSARAPGEGLRIGAVRYPPRGVRKEDYARENCFDVWMPVLAPSRRLMAGRKKLHRCDSTSWHWFFESYEREMRTDTSARQTIEMLAMLSRRTPISVGCNCSEGTWCHVSVLLRLLEEARTRGEQGLGRNVEICKPGRGLLYPTGVYTLVHPDTLAALAGKRGRHELLRGQAWVTGDELVQEAMLVRQRVPILFGDATDVLRLIGWAQLECMDQGKRGPSYWVSRVRRLRQGHRPQDLVLVKGGRKIRAGYIRPYAICRTPDFLR
jgi:uncharacterized protein YeaO (DUF488 family)